MNGKLNTFYKGDISITFEEMKFRFPDIPENELKVQYDKVMLDSVYVNDEYQVNMSCDSNIIHLSIKRIDKEPIHDWRDLQEIKNIFLGTESEAVELYPAESRLIDSANQYHLWSFIDDNGNPIKFDFGWKARLVDYEPSLESNIKQRAK
jgi:hypothetical protein